MSRRAFPGPIGAVLAVAIMAVALLASCVTPPEARSEAQVEQEIFRLVNEERQSAGLALLDRDPLLDALARQYAASGFSDAVERSTDIRHLRCNSWRTAYNNGSPVLRKQAAREQVDYCLANPNLSATMLRSDARATGVGVAIVGDAVYYVQVFDVLNMMSGDGGPLVLHENPEARDPSWAQLRRFVLDDDTDEQPYVEGSFVCADFAAMLHDRAEAEGIRTAYVSVDLASGPGHTLNAFDTTDAGLVYIDCTGQGLSFATQAGISGGDTSSSYDKVAYLSAGHEYGLIGMPNVLWHDDAQPVPPVDAAPRL